MAASSSAWRAGPARTGDVGPKGIENDAAASDPDTRPAQLTWLVRTKLSPPPVRPDHVSRGPPVERLRQAARRAPLVLVSAPAGYGKTTLVSSLIPAMRDFAFAWLAIDEDDEDPARFLSALIAALQTLEPACGTAALAAL